MKSDLDMTAKQLHERKLRLQREICKLVREFYDETGITPTLAHGPIQVVGYYNGAVPREVGDRLDIYVSIEL